MRDGFTPSTSAVATPPAVIAGAAARYGQAPAIGNTQKAGLYDDAQWLKLFKDFKRECFADRWIFERQWTRNIHYVNGRQWLAPYSRTEGWRDARIAKGVPKPVTNMAKDVDQSIRAMFASIRFGTIIRPTNQSQAAIVTAATCDDLMPLLHDAHHMNANMTEGDYWLVNTGNVVMHSAWDYSAEWGVSRIPYEHCLACGFEATSDVIMAAKQRCPKCGGNAFTEALDPETEEPRVKIVPKGCAVTTPLSLLECAFPMSHARWVDVPGLVRIRWREKAYFEEHDKLRELLPQLKFNKASSERSLQIFKSLPYLNDMSSARNQFSGGLGFSGSEGEGIEEYEMWLRPTPVHPEGRVARFYGDANPIVCHLEDEEGLPGDLPYHDGKGNPLFTFAHAGYHHVGGRVIASGVHDPVIEKYNQVNRLDSLIEMIIMRMAAPQWMLPKGSEVAWLGEAPGLPGLLLEWNAQIAGPNGRPERIPGIGPDASLMQWRKMLLADIEELTGTFNIIRGAKPINVSAFSALQMLDEAGQRRFTNVFQSRGDMYREWASFALELEREFGPDERTIAVMLPGRSYAFKQFKHADLRGDVTIVIEDGTYTPKTSLGERAAIEHLNQMGGVDMKDPDQRFAVYQKFGQTSVAPALSIQVSRAAKKQDDFVKWVFSGAVSKLPSAPNPQTGVVEPQFPPNYPLKWQRWFNPEIHRQEFLKWANSDIVSELLAQYPEAEGLLTAHLMEIDLAITEKAQGSQDPGGLIDMPALPGGTETAGGTNGGAAPPQPPAPGGGRGAARAMRNSNTNSAPMGGTPPPGGGESAQAGAVGPPA